MAQRSMVGVMPRVSDRVYRIQAPYEGNAVHLYLVRGAKLALIDSGAGDSPQAAVAPALRELAGALASRGLTVVGVGEDPAAAFAPRIRDGVAWVRPVGIETWGLIDESGRLLIDPRNGYLGVGSFSDGLAWVSRDGLGGWFAVDKTNRMVIQSSFERRSRMTAVMLRIISSMRALASGG